MTIIPIRPDDVLQLKKPHPCGGNLFRVLRVGAEVRVEKAKPVPAFLTGTANTFGDGIPFEVRSEKGNAVVTVTLPGSKPKRKVVENGSQVWEDDVVEVFFSRNGIFRQFVLASGGGRYSGDGQKELFGDIDLGDAE